MDVALDGGQDDLTPARGDCAAPLLIGLHQRQQIGDRLFHHAGRFDHLRQEHLPFAEQVAHDLHAGHQGTLDDGQAGGVLAAGFFGVLLDVFDNPFDQRMAEAIFHGPFAPGCLGLVALGRPALERLGQIEQPLRGVGPAIQEHVFDVLQQVGRDLFVDVELPGVDDGHVEPGADRVIQKCGVHGPAHRLVAAERERDVAHAAGDFHLGEELLDPARGLDEIQRVAVVLLDARADGEDVGVEDDVGRVEAHLFGQEVVRPLGDLHLVLDRDRLPLFVEHHHDAGGAVAPNEPGVAEELFFALLEADRIDDAFALHALQPGLEDRPFRAVDHHRHAGDVGLGGHEVQQAGHHGFAVQQPVVQVDVDDVRAPLHLAPGDGHGLVHPAVAHEPGETPGAGHVGPFADHQKRALGSNDQRLEAAVAGGGLDVRGLARGVLSDRRGDRPDVVRRGPAAAAHDVQPAVGGELAQHLGHLLRCLVVVAKLVGQACVGVATGPKRRNPRKLLDKRTHQRRPQRAVDSHAEEVGMGDRDPERLERLARQRAAAPVGDRDRSHHRQPLAVILKALLDGEQAGLEVERVEGRLRQEEVDAPFHQRGHLLGVGVDQIVERDRPVAGIVHVG